MLSEIDEFEIFYNNSGEFIPIYKFPNDDNMDVNADVTTDGKTFANNILINGITSTAIEVRVTTVVDRAVN